MKKIKKLTPNIWNQKGILYIFNPWTGPSGFHNFFFHRSRLYRDVVLWNFNRKHRNWCKFAKKHKLWVHITDDYLDKFI